MAYTSFGGGTALRRVVHFHDLAHVRGQEGDFESFIQLVFIPRVC